MTTLDALQDLLHTNLRIKNEGQELFMRGYGGTRLCKTVACVAGWHTIYDGHYQIEDPDFANVCHAYTLETSEIVARSFRTRTKVDDILFGVDRANDIDKQIYVTRWFIAREEKLQEYNRIRAMPRKERRRLRLAA